MSIRITLLPAFGGDDSQLQRLTTFLVNDTLAIDAGSLGYALSPDRLLRVRDVILTHAHLDHVSSLPIAVADIFGAMREPLRVWGLPHTLEAIRTHLFNDDVWVDFTRFKLMKAAGPCMELREFQPGERYEIAGLSIRPVSVEHPVPTVGLIVESPTAAVAFTSDTSRLDMLLQAVKDVPNLQAIFVDCSFPSGMEGVAQRSGHMTPGMIVEQLAAARLVSRPRVMCVHIKPSHREKTVREVEGLGERGLEVVELGREYGFE